MARDTFTLPNNPLQAYTELTAAIPALAPVNAQAQLLVESAGNALTLTYPDSVPKAAIAAVLALHVPKPVTVPPTRQQALAAIRAQLGSASSVADIKTALLALINED